MAETDCRPQIHACAIRVSRLDSNGIPTAGADSAYISDSLVTMSVSPVYTDGDEIEDKNACGVVGVNFRANDSLKRADVTLQIITPDPFLSEMLSGGSVLDPGGGAPMGWAAPSIGEVTGNGVSIELWAKRIDNGDLDLNYPYAHWAYPKVRNLRLGDYTHENGSNQPTFSGQAVENSQWFDGPGDDWPNDSTQFAQWVPTATLPTTGCAYVTVSAS
jgi:hypothetical protein